MYSKEEIEDKEMMVVAYSVFYDIEMRMIHHIVERFQECYKSKWRMYLDQAANIDSMTYTQLVLFFTKQPRIFPHIDPHSNQKLYKLRDIRNKIAHMKPLTNKEFQYLVQCHELALELMGEKVNC